MLHLIDKSVVVLGLGVSGAAAASLCLARGARVTAFDGMPRERLPPYVRELEARGVRILTGDHSLAAIRNADLVVISPGFPPFPELDALGVPVISEVELAFEALEEPAPAVVA